MKNQKGITLVSLVITIVLMLIIAGTTVYTSTNRFKINNLKKMQNDIELLNDKVNNYYLKYGGLPVLRNDSNEPINYTFRTLKFDKNVNDDENYYIIDLAAIGNITLNYGKEGYNNPNNSDDVYIINNKTHTVYYVKGIESNDGNIYHSLKLEDIQNTDNIPPTTPQINVVSGDQIDENNYETNVTLEFVPGKDNWSGVSKTTYSINGSTEQNIDTLENHQYPINEKGTYKITLKTYDNNNILSEEKKTIYIGQIKQVEYLESTGTQYIDTEYFAKDTTNYEIKASLVNVGFSRDGALFGTRTAGGSKDSFILWLNNFQEVNNPIVAPVIGKSGSQIITVDYDTHIYRYKDQNFYIDDDKKITFMNELDKSLFPTYLFGLNHGGSVDRRLFIGKIYYFKIYENNTLVKDFIPLVNQNNIACLYDKVEGKFYYNKGTGTFKTNLNE